MGDLNVPARANLIPSGDKSGGGLSDLMSAFKMLDGGLKDFATTQAYLNTKDQVDQINNSSLDQDAKMSQLKQVSQDMTFKLASLGTPVSEIQQVANNFSPKAPMFQTPEEVLLHPLSSQDQKQTAQRLIDEKRQASSDLLGQKIQGQFDSLNAKIDANSGKTDATLEKDHTKQMDTIRPAINGFEASIRKNGGRLFSASSKLQEIQNGLLGGDDPNKVNKIQLKEGLMSAASVFTGGVPTKDTIDGLFPDTLKIRGAALQTATTGELAPLNSGPLVNQVGEMTGTLKNTIDAQVSMGQKDTLRTKSKILENNPRIFNDTAQLVKLPDGTPDTPYLDSKNKVRFQSDDKIQELVKAVEHANDNPTDPASKQMISMVKNDPFYIRALVERPQLRGQIMRFYGKAKQQTTAGPAQ